MSTGGYPYLKGHGTQNDFVVLPDVDGSVHGDLAAERVRALADRHAGLGADGVLRLIRTGALADGAPYADEAEWFMDYRNADGSVSETCGNGIRVFAEALIAQGLVPPTAERIPVATRAGVVQVDVHEDGTYTVDMGEPQLLGDSMVGVPGHAWEAIHVDMGNPHAVAFVDALEEAGPLTEAPHHDDRVYPEGVNVEFAVRRGPGHLAMRVHERGVGETLSCGTGACAVAVAAMDADGVGKDGSRYRVDVPGGVLQVEWTESNHVLLTGPAVLVATGETSL